MASTIAANPETVDIRIHLIDESGEDTTVTLPLAGDTTDADIQTFVDNYATLTNAIVDDVTIVKRFVVTGIAVAGKPAVTPQTLVAAILALTFEKPHPIAPSGNVRKQVLLPAYVNAIRNDAVTPHVPVTGNANLDAITAFLEDALQYEGLDGVGYPGGWTYNPASKFGTRLTVTDGL